MGCVKSNLYIPLRAWREAAVEHKSDHSGFKSCTRKVTLFGEVVENGQDWEEVLRLMITSHMQIGRVLSRHK